MQPNMLQYVMQDPSLAGLSSSLMWLATGHFDILTWQYWTVDLQHPGSEHDQNV